MKLTLYCIIFNLAAMLNAGAIVINTEAGPENDAAQIATMAPAIHGKLSMVPKFNYWDHVGTVGMGSGVYLGGGYVLTSAHVGCHPFRMDDGSTYKPDYASWRILNDAAGCKGDLAIFRVEMGKATSPLAQLGFLPVGDMGASAGAPFVMIGTGYGQSKNGVAPADRATTLGYNVERLRQKKWGINSLDKILQKPVATAGGYQTHCFVSTFDRTEGEAQAADGDSGGAIFAYNAKLERWEIVGCIVAVSQLGNYVPFGSRTYVGNLSYYQAQLPNSSTAEVKDGIHTVATTSLPGAVPTVLTRNKKIIPVMIAMKPVG